MKLFFYLAWLVIGEQWYEAWFEANKKWQSKIIQSVWIASWFLLLAVGKLSGNWLNFVWVGVCYWLIRIGLADIVGAEFRGLPPNYQGTTTWIWDKIINRLKNHINLYIIFCFACCIGALLIDLLLIK